MNEIALDTQSKKRGNETKTKKKKRAMATHTHQQDGTILTRRLLLRGAQESDLESLHELFTDEDVMRYW